MLGSFRAEGCSVFKVWTKGGGFWEDYSFVCCMGPVRISSEVVGLFAWDFGSQ